MTYIIIIVHMIDKNLKVDWILKDKLEKEHQKILNALW